MMDVQKLRNETPGCQGKIHLNNAGASLMPRPVIQAMEDHITLESLQGGYEAADQRTEEVSHFYDAVAALLNTTARNIAFSSSATNAYAKALSCIPFETGDTIVIANEDYISNQIAFLSLQKRFGINLVRAASLMEGGVDVADMKRLIDLHHPRLVSLTHIPTNTGLIQPVEEVGRLCRERNILYLVDACQSAGQLPLDVAAIGCDFLSATFRKFLRGPRGAGFLYVSDRVLHENLEPLFIDMRGADWTQKNDYQARRDARLFEEWELPYALVLGSAKAVDYALAIGLKSIEDRNNSLCSLLRRQIETLPGVRTLDQGKHLSSIVTLSIPNQKPKDLLDALRLRSINTSISYRNFALIDFVAKGIEWALRISPHYYNTEKEIESLVGALRDLNPGKS